MPPGVPHVSSRFLTEEEKANAPKVTKAFLIRIFSYLKPDGCNSRRLWACFPSSSTGRIVDEALVGENLAFLARLLPIALATTVVSGEYPVVYLTCAI